MKLVLSLWNRAIPMLALLYPELWLIFPRMYSNRYVFTGNENDLHLVFHPKGDILSGYYNPDHRI